MVFTYLIYVLFLAVSFGISIVLAIRVLNNSAIQGRTSLMTSNIAVAIWTFGYALEIISGGMEEKLFWAKVQYIGISFVANGIFLVIMEYSGHTGWLGTTRRMLLGIIPLLTVILAFSNDQFRLIWTKTSVMPGLSVSPLVLTHGPWFYIIIFYSYILLAVSTAQLVKKVSTPGKLYRNQAIVMLIGLIMPWVGNFIYASGIIPLANLDLTPLMLTFTNITFLIGFLRVRLMDIIPIAQDAVFRSMSEAVIVLDERWRIIELNPAALGVFEPGGNYIGSDITTLLPKLEQWLQEDSKGALELNIADQLFFLRSDPIINQHGIHNGQLVILTNITERKRYEAELLEAHTQAVEANRIKTRLLANISHDLRTPLNAIMGYTEMLRADFFGPLTPEQDNATAEILDSTNKLLIFINNLIGQAQIETGHILIKERAFNPGELVEGIHSTVKFWAQKKGIGLSYDIDSQFPTQIIGDPYWLNQILLNLVSNALKFTDEGGVYVFIAQPDEAHWSISVRDTGIGIPAEAQKSVFDAFHQIENTSTNKTSGSGLGLAIVGQLVTLMKGEISLESEVSRGSTFIVTLPLVISET